MSLGKRILLGLFIVVLSISFVFFYKFNNCSISILMVFRSLLIGTMGGITVVIIASLPLVLVDTTKSISKEKYELIESYAIEALQDYKITNMGAATNADSPCFIALATGAAADTNSSPVYKVSRVVGSGEWVDAFFPAENTTIYETSADYRVEHYDRYEYSDNSQRLFFPSDKIEPIKKGPGIYKIYVPEDSVVGGTNSDGVKKNASSTLLSPIGRP